jgi:hypothetical protein
MLATGTGSTPKTPLISPAATNNATQTLFCKRPDGVTLTLEFNVNQTTVKAVKDTIAQNVGGSLTSDNIRLLYAQTMLEDDKLLGDYDFCKNDLSKVKVIWRNLPSQVTQPHQNDDDSSCCTLF